MESSSEAMVSSNNRLSKTGFNDQEMMFWSNRYHDRMKEDRLQWILTNEKLVSIVSSNNRLYKTGFNEQEMMFWSNRCIEVREMMSPVQDFT